MSVVPITKLPPPSIQSRLTLEPTCEPLLLQKIKDHSHIIGNDEDGWLSDTLIALRRAVEDWAQIALISQTWEQVFDGVPNETWLEYKRIPVITHTSFKYYSSAGVEADVESATYTVDKDTRWPRIYLNEGCSWPDSTRTKRSMVLVYTAGFGTSSDAVPMQIRLAMLKAIDYQYRHREAGAELLTPELKNLLKSYRRDWL